MISMFEAALHTPFGEEEPISMFETALHTPLEEEPSLSELKLKQHPTALIDGSVMPMPDPQPENKPEPIYSLRRRDVVYCQDEEIGTDKEIGTDPLVSNDKSNPEVLFAFMDILLGIIYSVHPPHKAEKTWEFKSATKFLAKALTNDDLDYLMIVKVITWLQEAFGDFMDKVEEVNNDPQTLQIRPLDQDSWDTWAFTQVGNDLCRSLKDHGLPTSDQKEMGEDEVDISVSPLQTFADENSDPSETVDKLIDILFAFMDAASQADNNDRDWLFVRKIQESKPVIPKGKTTIVFDEMTPEELAAYIDENASTLYGDSDDASDVSSIGCDDDSDYHQPDNFSDTTSDTMSLCDEGSDDEGSHTDSEDTDSDDDDEDDASVAEDVSLTETKHARVLDWILNLDGICTDGVCTDMDVDDVYN